MLNCLHGSVRNVNTSAVNCLLALSKKELELDELVFQFYFKVFFPERGT